MCGVVRRLSTTCINRSRTNGKAATIIEGIESTTVSHTITTSGMYEHIQVKQSAITITVGQEADGAGDYARQHVHRDRQQVCRGRLVTYIASEPTSFFCSGRLTELVGERSNFA